MPRVRVPDIGWTGVVSMWCASSLLDGSAPLREMLLQELIHSISGGDKGLVTVRQPFLGDGLPSRVFKGTHEIAQRHDGGWMAR